MKNHVVYFATWGLYISILSLLFFFIKDVQLFFLFSFITGSFLGFVIPIVLDVVLPMYMKGTATLSKETVQTVVEQTANQVKSGNVYDKNLMPTPLRSYPLLFGYFVMAVFIITSTSNWIGTGFVLGLGLYLALDLWFSKTPTDYLRKRWFSVFHTNLSDTELRYFVWGSIGGFGIITLLSVLV